MKRRFGTTVKIGHAAKMDHPEIKINF